MPKLFQKNYYFIPLLTLLLFQSCLSLHHYVGKNDYYGVEKAIEKEGEINKKDDNGDTALIAAIKNSLNDIALLLIQSGTDIELTGSQGDTPLILSIKKSNETVFYSLLEAGADINNSGDSGEIPLNHSIKNPEIVYFKELLNRKANFSNVDKNNLPPMFLSIKEGMDKKLKMLLSQGDDPNKKWSGVSAIEYSIKSNNNNALEILLNSGVNLKSVSKPIQLAIQKRNFAILKILTKHTNPNDLNQKNSEGNTAIHFAVENNDVEILKYLISNKAEINVVNNLGHSPLYKAVTLGNVEIVGILLKEGADPNSEDIKGNTIIDLTAKKLSGEILEVLLRNNPTPKFNNFFDQIGYIEPGPEFIKASNLGVVLIENFKFNQALKLYAVLINKLHNVGSEKYLYYKGQMFNLFFNRAICNFNLGKKKAAKEDLKTAMTIDSRRNDLPNGISPLLTAQDQLEEIYIREVKSFIPGMYCLAFDEKCNKEFGYTIISINDNCKNAKAEYINLDTRYCYSETKMTHFKLEGSIIEFINYTTTKCSGESPFFFEQLYKIDLNQIKREDCLPFLSETIDSNYFYGSNREPEKGRKYNGCLLRNF
jgi:ankyrin repeat protein